MVATDPDALAATLQAVAEGEIPLSQVAGLGGDELALVLGQAIAQMKIGRDAKAIPILKVLVALDEKKAVFHEYLGLAHERLGQYDEALASYSKNLEVLGHLPDADERLCEGYLLRARLFAQCDQMTEAGADIASAKTHQDADPALAQEIVVLERVVSEARS